MKKLLSAVLAFAMLCSAFVFNVSAADPAREEFLNSPKAEPLDLTDKYNADTYISGSDYQGRADSDVIADIVPGKTIFGGGYIKADSVLSELENIEDYGDYKTGFLKRGNIRYFTLIPNEGKSVKNSLRLGQDLTAITGFEKSAKYMSVVITTASAEGFGGISSLKISGKDAAGKNIEKTVYLFTMRNSLSEGNEYKALKVISKTEAQNFRRENSAVITYDDVLNSKIGSDAPAELKISDLESYVEDVYIGTPAVWGIMHPRKNVNPYGEFDSVSRAFNIDIQKLGFSSVSALQFNGNDMASTNEISDRCIASDGELSDCFGNLKAAKQFAYIPLKPKDGGDNFYLFYSGRVCKERNIVNAVTFYNDPLIKTVREIEDMIGGLSDIYRPEEKSKIAEVKTKLDQAYSTGIEEGDFDTALINKFNELYYSAKQEIESEQIKSIEEIISDMSYAYVSPMREKVEGVKASLDSLDREGIGRERFDTALMEKFDEIYGLCRKAAAIEDAIDALNKEYSYTMYNDVISVYGSYMSAVEGGQNEKCISDERLKKITSLEKTGVYAKKKDEEIEALPSAYSKEYVDKIVEIYSGIENMRKEGIKDIAYNPENLAKINDLYKSAASDILESDIAEVSKRIEALPLIYTNKFQNEVLSIKEGINSINERGGVLPQNLLDKFSAILNQMNESGIYVPFKLKYTNDVFASRQRYAEQLTEKNSQGKWIQPDGMWGLHGEYIHNTALADEDNFISKLSINQNDWTAVLNGIKFQFGKITSSVDGVSNDEKNAFLSSALKKFTVDVDKNIYKNIHLAAWASKNDSSITVTYNYTDGSSSQEKNIKTIKGGSSVAAMNGYTKILNPSGKADLECFRGYNPQNDSGKYGSYSFYLTDHILTPDDTKMLKSITFETTENCITLFAMTGESANSASLKKTLDETMSALPDMEESMLRESVDGLSNIMTVLDEKGVAYDTEYKEKIENLKKEYITVTSIKTYTDIDYKTYTVDFSGPVADSSVNKAMFEVKKNNEAFEGYTVEKASPESILVKIKNDFNYSDKYELKVSKNILGAVSGKSLYNDSETVYNAKPAVDVEINISNGAGEIVFTNNMTAAQSVSAVIAVYGKDNSMNSRKLVLIDLEPGESSEPQRLALKLSQGQTIECTFVDSLKNCREIYRVLKAEER